MNSESFLKRKHIVPFLGLTYLLPLPILLLRVFDWPGEPILFYAAWTPNIAALLVTALIVKDKGGVKRLLSGWGIWRVGARWYLAALSPLALALLSSILLLIFGRETTEPTQPLGLAILITALVALLTGALGEELGWRGFLLPRLQERLSWLTSSLFVGVVWAAWHAPLWLLPGQGWDTTPYWPFAALIIASSVLITWVYNGSGSSLVLATIFHFSINFGNNLMPVVGLPSNPDEYWIVASILYVLYAGIVAVIGGHKRSTRENA